MVIYNQTFYRDLAKLLELNNDLEIICEPRDSEVYAFAFFGYTSE